MLGLDCTSAVFVARAIIRTFVCVLNVFTAIPTYLVWTTLLQPLRHWKPELYHLIEGTVYRWLQQQVAYWCWSGGYKVVEVGADVSDLINDECLVMANHQTTADVPLLMSVLSHTSKSTLGHNVYWIMDHIFRFLPFGWVSVMHGDFFIRQGRDTRQSQLTDLRHHLREIYVKLDRTWIVLFPEGGFLFKRLKSSQEYARKNGYPVLEHVTLPRIGAIHTILSELSPMAAPIANGICGARKRKTIKWIIDLTIAYPSKPSLDLPQIWMGSCPPCSSVVHFRRFSSKDVPCEEDALLQWLYKRWMEKEELLDCFYKTGRFPASDGDIVPRLLALDDQWCFLLLVVFVVSTWIHVKLLMSGLALFTGLLWF